MRERLTGQDCAMVLCAVQLKGEPPQVCVQQRAKLGSPDFEISKAEVRKTGWPRVVADPGLPQTRTCSH
jgi:hypothetical protein